MRTETIKNTEIKFSIFGSRKNPVYLVRGLKSMSSERMFGFLVNSGEEAEVIIQMLCKRRLTTKSKLHSGSESEEKEMVVLDRGLGG